MEHAWHQEEPVEIIDIAGHRQIDINDYDTSEDNVKEIKARFIEELKQACAKDNNALLAGIVDASVRKILVD